MRSSLRALIESFIVLGVLCTGDLNHIQYTVIAVGFLFIIVWDIVAWLRYRRARRLAKRLPLYVDLNGKRYII